jgi:hypothetical protein
MEELRTLIYTFQKYMIFMFLGVVVGETVGRSFVYGGAFRAWLYSSIAISALFYGLGYSNRLVAARLKAVHYVIAALLAVLTLAVIYLIDNA